ncbi:Hemolysin, contains CBS domains [Halogranum rubrum]|uniref:Hemolysin, contains CBS domains n=1 Tax=Halogranum rubrum TaxID=553466 RepID=A0A1I4FEY6_9EURY|nr:hemolysin family protein [Halogranum rubrum]SFL15457.1 Hemolysin, contains CBS domains [Halogranum rubrum]
MVTTATFLRLLAGIVLLLGNGFFVTTEFAMTRVRQFSEAEFQGSRGLERAWEMTERLEIYLSGCQLGITICSVGLGVAAEPALSALLDPLVQMVGLGGGGSGGEGGHTALAAFGSLAIINLLHLTIGEQAPTYLGIERTKTIAKYGGPVLYWWTRILSPIIRLADWTAKALLSLFGVEITRSWAEEELEEGAEEATTRGELVSQMGNVLSNLDLPTERRREVINALAIDRISAADIMIPREDIVAVSTSKSTAENFETIRNTPHTRFPLVGASLDDPLGVIYVPALLQHQSELEAGEMEFADIAVDPMKIAPDLPVSELIDAFQEAHQELALVVDDGETKGMVTATDGFEVITGELEDPFDEDTDES